MRGARVFAQEVFGYVCCDNSYTRTRPPRTGVCGRTWQAPPAKSVRVLVYFMICARMRRATQKNRSLALVQFSRLRICGVVRVAFATYMYKWQGVVGRVIFVPGFNEARGAGADHGRNARDHVNGGGGGGSIVLSAALNDGLSLPFKLRNGDCGVRVCGIVPKLALCALRFGRIITRLRLCALVKRVYLSGTFQCTLSPSTRVPVHMIANPHTAATTNGIECVCTLPNAPGACLCAGDEHVGASGGPDPCAPPLAQLGRRGVNRCVCIFCCFAVSG